MEILTTADYKKFKFPVFGRVLAERAIIDKVQWVNEKPEEYDERLAEVQNQLSLVPIQCTKNMVIMEGKHRFEIARRLGLPITYVIVSKVNQPVKNPNKVLNIDKGE